MITPRYYFEEDFRKYEHILKTIKHSKESHRKGDVICDVDSNFGKIYYILKGSLRLSVLHGSGHEKTISFHGTGTIQPLYYPVEFQLEKSLIYTCMNDVEVLVFSKADIGKLAKENNEFNTSLLEGMVKLVNLLICDMSSALYDNGLIKICNFLYSYYIAGNRKCCIIELRQEELASVAGMNRINTAKYLRELRNSGIIKTERNRIIILNVRELYKLCSDEFVEVN
jgi:CRP-like cAMP-binding protein